MKTSVVGKQILIEVNSDRSFHINIPNTRKELFKKLLQTRNLLQILTNNKELEYENIKYFTTFNFYIKANYPDLLDKNIYLINSNFEETFKLNIERCLALLSKVKSKQDTVKIFKDMDELNNLYKIYIDYKFIYLP